MDLSNKTQVWACAGLRYDAEQIRAAVAAHFQRYCSSQGVSIAPGMRVLVKPFLQNGRTSDPGSRLTSHPLLIAAVLQWLRERGAQVLVGDMGLIRESGQVAPERQWIANLLERGGAQPVSFVASGFRWVRSRFLSPRHYPIARAVLEAELIINCGNAHPHPVWGLSGAVKNMFNSVLGRQQDYLLERSADRQRQAAYIADVCRIARPSLSFLDLTTVYAPLQPESPYPLGVLLAGCDPFALDAVAANLLGMDPAQLLIGVAGARLGLGQPCVTQIEVEGLLWPAHGLVALPLKAAPARKKPSFMAATKRLISKTLLRPRPRINAQACRGCGECLRLCPSQAIVRNADGKAQIRLGQCIDCEYCLRVCDDDAIQLEHGALIGRVRGFIRSDLPSINS